MMLTSVHGGHGGEEGGDGMTPTGGLGPPQPFFFFLEAPEHFFFKTAIHKHFFLFPCLQQNHCH